MPARSSTDHPHHGLLHHLREGVIEPLRHELHCRAGERALRELEDHLLDDIGLRRSEIHAAAHGLLGREPLPQGPETGASGTWSRAFLAAFVRRASVLALVVLASGGPAAWAAEPGGRRLPGVEDLPRGTVKVSGFVPGMGERWANPKDLPLGPIYGVMRGKVICAEFMMALRDLLTGRSFERLRLGMDGKLPPVNHVELTFMQHGHEGYKVSHYDLHMYFVPPTARFPERAEARR